MNLLHIIIIADFISHKLESNTTATAFKISYLATVNGVVILASIVWHAYHYQITK